MKNVFKSKLDSTNIEVQNLKTLQLINNIKYNGYTKIGSTFKIDFADKLYSLRFIMVIQF